MVAVEDAFQVVEKSDPGVVQGSARGVSRPGQTMPGLGSDYAQGVQGPPLIMLYIKGYTPKGHGAVPPPGQAGDHGTALLRVKTG